MRFRKWITMRIHFSRGFSLMELLITLAIFGILMAIVTNILVINLKVSRLIKARTYAREETAFMLNILKKDIRNAEDIKCPASNTTNKIFVVALDEGGRSHTYEWVQQGPMVQRDEVEVDMSCAVSGTPTRTYVLPSDIEFYIGDDNGNGIADGFELDISCTSNNCVVKISLKVRTIGMPDDQWIAKEVAVSTRNFEF